MLLGQEAVGAEGLAESEKRAVAEKGGQVQTGCAPSAAAGTSITKPLQDSHQQAAAVEATHHDLQATLDTAAAHQQQHPRLPPSPTITSSLRPRQPPHPLHSSTLPSQPQESTRQVASRPRSLGPAPTSASGPMTGPGAAVQDRPFTPRPEIPGTRKTPPPPPRGGARTRITYYHTQPTLATTDSPALRSIQKTSCASSRR